MVNHFPEISLTESDFIVMKLWYYEKNSCNVSNKAFLFLINEILKTLIHWGLIEEIEHSYFETKTCKRDLPSGHFITNFFTFQKVRSFWLLLQFSVLNIKICPKKHHRRCFSLMVNVLQKNQKNAIFLCNFTCIK